MKFFCRRDRQAGYARHRIVVQLDRALRRVNGFINRFSCGLLVFAHLIDVQDILLNFC